MKRNSSRAAAGSAGLTRVGVLALQGDFVEHIHVLESMGVAACEVRTRRQLDGLDGLIVPGGESTTMVKLIDAYGFREAIPFEIARGMALWGTCAGMIVVARQLTDPYPEPLGLIDITVSRNWFGRQIDSFEADLPFKGIGAEPFRAVFIRAPVVTSCGPGVKVLAVAEQGPPVAVRNERVLATAFHPELTDDARVHRYFLDMAEEKASDAAAEAALSTAGDGKGDQ